MCFQIQVIIQFPFGLKQIQSNVGARTLISQSDTSGSPFYFGSNSGSDLSGKIKMNQDWNH